MLSTRVITGITFITLILIITVGIIIYITDYNINPAQSLAPPGSIVRLRNVQTGHYLGICRVGTSIPCVQGPESGDFATTSTNIGSTGSISWFVNVDQNTNYTSLQNVGTSNYLANFDPVCYDSNIPGNIAPIKLSQTQPFVYNTSAANGWFGVIFVTSTRVQLYTPNYNSSGTIIPPVDFLGTDTNNVVSNSCAEMVSTGFNQSQISQTSWDVEIVSGPS